MDAPSIEYGQLSPMLIVFGVAVAGVLVEAFVPRGGRFPTQLVLTIGGLVAAFGAVLALSGTRDTAVAGSVVVDGPTLFLQGAILLLSLLSVLLVAGRTSGRVSTAGAFTPQAAAIPGTVAEKEATRAGVVQTEVFPLLMFAVGGMLLFPASGDLLTMFVALEVLSLPLYLLCGLARRRRLLSQEAALKYFLLGAFSSALFLYGVALLYGYAGTVSLTGIADAIAADAGDETMVLIGIALVTVGLLFKVGAVPFHSWVPDVYQGAPTPITAFMAATTKVAAFGATLRLFYVALPELDWDWQPVLWAVAIASMLLGAILAVTQTDVKRMLAYSSVSHAGFILTGLVAADGPGLSSTLFYLATYGFTALGAFAVVGLVRGRDGESNHLARWAGLARQSPLAAGVFSLFLLSMAGIPLTSGFVAKFAVFQAAAGAGAGLLVVVGVLASAIAAVFYVRVIVLMYFSPPPDSPPDVVPPGPFTTTVLATCAAVTVVFGIVPQPLLDLANQAAVFLH
ncbi:NADH-quinone oxidoreductase subunit NuoN [Rhodococcus triatomae]|nr:NADH-quinone oxidoreductase subunit NuoN [Rhodococcus triatomae]QNG25664.1 NADH-quinone oxidoreductase subunit NuoN [Rhodococcus triatomae]